MNINDTHNVSARGNYFQMKRMFSHDSPGDGIEFHGDYSRVLGNSFYGNLEHDVHIRASNSVVMGNTCFNQIREKGAIDVWHENDVYNVVIAGNVCAKSGDSKLNQYGNGIRTGLATGYTTPPEHFGLVIVNNVCVDNEGAGIYIRGYTRDSIVANNYCENNCKSGGDGDIMLRPEGADTCIRNVSIIGNTVVGGNKDGIFHWQTGDTPAGATFSVRDNVVRLCQRHGIRLRGARNTVCAGNDVIDCNQSDGGYYGIYCDNAPRSLENVPVKDNRVISNSTPYHWIGIASAPRAIENFVKNTSGFMLTAQDEWIRNKLEGSGDFGGISYYNNQTLTSGASPALTISGIGTDINALFKGRVFVDTASPGGDVALDHYPQWDSANSEWDYIIEWVTDPGSDINVDVEIDKHSRSARLA